MISDGFLPWSLEYASKLWVPRLVFDGVSSYAMKLYKTISEHDFPTSSDDDVFRSCSIFPWPEAYKECIGNICFKDTIDFQNLVSHLNVFNVTIILSLI